MIFGTTHFSMPRQTRVEIKWLDAMAFSRRNCHNGHRIAPHTRYAIVRRGPEIRVMCAECAGKVEQ